MKRRPGRPKKGQHKKETCSIRIDGVLRKKVIKDFGSVQKWADMSLNWQFGSRWGDGI